jgi:phage major head subunit gpT-like protein
MATAGTYSTLDNNNLIGLFDQMYEQQLNGLWAAKVGMVMPSDSLTETYGWLGGAPTLDELKGEGITEEGLKQFSYTLTNKEYAKALKFREVDMRRDKLGQIQARIGELADKAADHWNSLVATLITGNGLAYDGQNFFDTDHDESGTSQVNAVTASQIADLNIGTATAPTPDEAAKVIAGMIGYFYTYTDDKGSEINGNAKSFTFMVGTVNLWAPLMHAAKALMLTSGASNPVQGLLADGINIDVRLVPALSAGTTYVYAFRNDSRVKPFILQEEVAIDPQMTDANSDEYKKFRRFLFSIYTSRAAGYGRWQSAMRATLS